MLARLSGKKYFSSLDLKSGYNQLKIAVEDRDVAGFTWNNKRYRFKDAPFGLKRLSGLSENNECFENFCMHLIDDITVFSSSIEEHI